MRKYATILTMLCLPTLVSLCDEPASTPVAKTEQPTSTTELKEPFNAMSPSDRISTGIAKLSASEQEALAAWWKHRRHTPQQRDISREVTIAAVQDGGKHMVMSDGARVSFSSSMKKRVSRWSVGDKIGFGTPGKKGSVTLYHMASGQKAKAKRDQAPTQAAQCPQEPSQPCNPDLPKA